MRALESGAEKIYVVTYPEDACRYGKVNVRTRKRLAYVQGLIEEIGMRKDRLEVIQLAAGTATTIDRLTREILGQKAATARSRCDKERQMYQE
jgi:coenzyme F420-reducing hydrogenase delta subunit